MGALPSDGDSSEVGICAHLTEEEAESIVGEPVYTTTYIGEAGMRDCFYTFWLRPSRQVVFTLRGADLYASNRTSWSDERPVAGIGQEAVWSEENAMISVLVNGQTLQSYAEGFGEEENRRIVLEVARTVAGRL